MTLTSHIWIILMIFVAGYLFEPTKNIKSCPGSKHQPKSVEIVGCSSAPCKFSGGDNVTVIVTFKLGMYVSL